MEIKKPKSHVPIIHDNTEENLILVPPSVLDNKLRDFEIYHKERSSLPSDITLAITLLVAIFTASFVDFPFISGSTIRGSFIAGLILILVKIGFSVFKMIQADGSARTDLIGSLVSNIKNEVKEK